MQKLAEILVSGVVVGSIYGLIGLGIVLVYKGSRVLNFAQPEVGTFALFITWQMVEWGQPWIVGAAAGVLVAALLSLAFERLVVARMTDAPRLTVAVATVGLTLLLLGLEIKIWPGALKVLAAPISGEARDVFGVNVSPTQLVALGMVALLGLGLGEFLRCTDFGLGVVAAAQDPLAVRLVGVRLSRVSMFTWTSAGVLAAIAALLIQPTISTFAPGFMVTAVFVPALAAALLGGMRSLPGTFVGGLVIGVLDQGMQRAFIQTSAVPGAEIIAIYVVILAILLLRPQGLLVRRSA